MSDHRGNNLPSSPDTNIMKEMVGDTKIRKDKIPCLSLDSQHHPYLGRE